ncbi:MULTISPECIES: ABC transporter permease subunit [unclassified Leeuwenhoekiella]|uniref:ABC transporter permease n=1 Tax=unclassified Leeuwenhoekiella TaxID=2615029 RepID=UPI000C571342|nr:MULTISPECIES: ABC transporter permease subunit [unclassified Leeuwenhoekiella]MAW94874.1 ABC transporter permease [Leeuwenhoekiella sp.]MBA79594.1 ABC transporter permease [Leeuwenhoekiella sp.]|tara:strand:+ start:2565 stop:3395 length:831 start_codon:yes stop_codon:yes gene_type:complete
MLRLLTIEFYKLKHSRSSKVLSIAYFVILSFIALIASIEFNIGDIQIRIADQGIFNFPFIWHFNTWVAATLKFFLAIVIVSMISNEYSNRTLKQNLIDGLSKKEFILSKFYTVVAFSLLSTVFILIMTLILGYSFSDYTEFSIVTREMEFLFAYFLKLVGFFSFCLFLGVLVKRSAFALGFLFVWWIFENITYGILRWKVSENLADSVVQFFPLESMKNLINLPFQRLSFIETAANQLQADISIDYAVHWYEVVIVSVWIFIFIYTSYALLKKRDL